MSMHISVEDAEGEASAGPYILEHSTMAQLAGLEPEMRPWEEIMNSNAWTQDPTTATTSFIQYSSPQTPSTLSHSSGLSTSWSTEAGDVPDPKELHEFHRVNSASMSGRWMPCSCLIVILQMLQSLHQNFRQPPAPQQQAISSLSYAAVLSMNEEAATYCNAMLRCSSCQKDDKGDSFTILASLIRRVLILTEAWVEAPPAKPQNERLRSNVVQGHLCDQRDDAWRLKAQILLIGIKKMESVVAELRQAGQELKVDYERLTCISLAVNLSARLKSASEIVGCI